MRPLKSFPAQLIEQIGDTSHSQGDLLALSQTARRIYEILEPRFIPFNVKQHRGSGLRWAASHGDIALARRFLRRDVLNIDKFGRSTLTHESLGIALEVGHEDIAILLLNHGTDLRSAITTSPASLLDDAARKGKVSLARKLINMGIESPHPMIAVETGNLQCFELLLDSWEQQVCPLHLSNMSYLLRQAVKRGHTGIVRALLARGTAVDEYSPASPQTCLYDAIEGRKIEIINLLLEKGANLCHNLPSLEYILKYGGPGYAEQRRDTVRVLRKASAAIQDDTQCETLDRILVRWE